MWYPARKTLLGLALAASMLLPLGSQHASPFQGATLARAAAGDFTVTPTTLTFPDTAVGGTSSLPVTITNVSSFTLTPNFSGGAPLDLTNFGGFQDCQGKTFAPGDTCTFTYEFHPVSPGLKSTSATIGIDDQNFPITMSGTGLSSTAVGVQSLSAIRTSRGVSVHWHTGTEADLLGFQVYRSRGHSWRRITNSLMAAKGSVSGASYRFLDRTAKRGVFYRYRIKAVNSDATASWFGPVRVT
jgi:hypothetical protein